MEEKNHTNLQKAIEELPEMEPQPGLWNQIEDKLLFEATLTKVLPSMPQFEPEEYTWQKMERKLPAKPKVSRQVISLRLFNYISAACIVLVIAAGLFFLPTYSNSVTLSYSQEMYFEELQIEMPAQQEEMKEALGFIETSCESQVLVCQTPQFQQLKGQLDELQREMQFLKEQQTLYGQEPELVKAQIKLENLQAQITKELIRLIVS